MPSTEQDEAAFNRIILAGLALMGLTGAGAVFILMAQSRGSAPAPQVQPAQPGASPSRPSVFDSARSETELSSQLNARAALGRERTDDPGAASPAPTMGYRPEPAPAAPAVPPPAAERRPAPPPAAPAPAPGPELSRSESAALDQATGGWGDKVAARIGATGPLLVKAVVKVLKYPKVVEVMLGNKLLIDAFMSSSRVQRKCSSPQALADYLSDTKDPVGVKLFQSGFKGAMSSQEGLGAVLGSKLTSTVMQNCSSVGAMVKNPAMVKQIAENNPEALMMLMNPNLILAMTKAPLVMGTIGEFQKTQTGGKR
ncbi:MAG TPA: hypothetical protein DCM05_07780 [Elusimicrobia bacterium]|nr:hypothetical protein [Elusimicrobiota bacterium]